MCPYCDGYGHSGNDCPTDAKIAHLRGGVREQNQLLMKLRKELRDASNMKEVTGFSLLSASKPTIGVKRTHRERFNDAASVDNGFATKRTRF